MSDITPIESYNKKIKRIHVLVHGMIAGNLNGVVISGSPGVGKSHNVLEALSQYGERINVTEVKGHITPYSVFNTLMNNCEENDVIMFDDADSCFSDHGSLNLLKAACDTYPVRTVSWLSSANLGVQSFQFKGKVIILTNTSLKNNAHYSAMMDRFVCYTPEINTIEKLAKIREIASNSIDISHDIGNAVVDFLFANETKLKEITLRTFVKTAQLATSIGDGWVDIAECVILNGE